MMNNPTFGLIPLERLASGAIFVRFRKPLYIKTGLVNKVN
jgi:hypothetical protein